MDKYERRRLALERLKDQVGGVAELARRLERDSSYVSRMLYPGDKPGRKRIADDMMELITSKFPGWLEPMDMQGEIAHDPLQSMSPAARHVVERLERIERSNSASPALFDALEKILDLAEFGGTRPAGKRAGKGYDNLMEQPTDDDNKKN